ncbi:MAG: glycoside hydrolase family 127 protein [Bacteroidales bacterium]|nr:glycoside hydrolase family 127 protein [Bacteroidales bacterium]
MKVRFIPTVALLGCLLLSVPAADLRAKTIRKVSPVRVETPEGSAPRLPWQVRVRYSDRTREWRQVRWTGVSREEEADQAARPAGSVYTVRGYVIGDSTTPEGYPLEARVRVVKASRPLPAPEPVARPLPLGDVRLTGNNRLTGNRDLDVRQLLSLDVTQMLYNYRDTYGLPTEGYTPPAGWDSVDTKLKGHGTGHYLSALAFAYAGTDDGQLRAALLQRLRRMVDEMRACQELTFVWSDSLGRYREARDLAPEAELRDLKGSWEAFDVYKRDCRSYGYGYLNAIPAQHPVLVEMYRPYNNRDWVWAPYYTIHKQLAGLVDIALNVGECDVADKALLIAKDMGLWVWNRLHYRTFVQEGGTQEERRSRPGNRYEMWNMYIAGEVGGMQESLTRLSRMVSDPQDAARLLEAAGYFDAPAFYGPLSRGLDDIRGRHANQHIPMVIGALQRFGALGEGRYYEIARNFWELVQGRYAYAAGGVGNGEMFREPYTQMLSLNTNARTGRQGETRPDPAINETCCAYNLAKLTRDLNGYDPDDARYMDYYERVLSNQIVGSVHPEHYGVTYQYAVGLDAAKPFGNETPQVSCCGGTGAENHVKYQEAAYFVSENTLWVALYLPTEAVWREKGVSLRQDCAWPAESSEITVSRGGRFAMKLRVPWWAGEDFEIRLNGRPIARSFRPCSYAVIPEREWRPGDRVSVRMPFHPHVFFGPDKMELAATAEGGPQTPFPASWEGALMYGPLVMASPDIHTWAEAECSLGQDLEKIVPCGADADEGTMGNVYTLKLGDRIFYPDYYLTGRGTRYLRLR